jgi:hypothetical protein
MIELILPPNYSGLLMAKCSEHGLIFGPERTDAAGKLTMVWRCTACEAGAHPEAKQAESVKETASAEATPTRSESGRHNRDAQLSRS